MFDLPDAKRCVLRSIPSSPKKNITSDTLHRVRREELYDASSDRHSSPEREHEADAELRAKLNARLSNLLSLNLDTPAQPENTNDETQPPNEEGGPDQDGAGEAEEFEFRLFSTSTAAAPKVVLAAEEDDVPFSGPALSQRPISHYIRGELAPHEREQFQRAAVTAQDVVAWAGQRAWGLEVPWRVTQITVTVKGAGHQQQQQGVAAAEKKKTKRPGKKSRIVLRKREKVRKEAEAALEKLKMSKEEHLKEKKKRLNREKKLKRRLKEKEKKMAAKGEAGAEGGEADSGSEESDGEE
jgi:hypothetical protein